MKSRGAEERPAAVEPGEAGAAAGAERPREVERQSGVERQPGVKRLLGDD